MKKRTLIAFCLLLFNFVHAQTRSANSKLQAIKLIVDFPVIEPDDLNLSHLRDTVSIYYYENAILYQLSRLHKYDVVKETSGAEEYFIFKRNSPRGFYFTASKPNKTQMKSVDSFLRERGYFGTKIDPTPLHRNRAF